MVALAQDSERVSATSLYHRTVQPNGLLCSGDTRVARSQSIDAMTGIGAHAAGFL